MIVGIRRHFMGSFSLPPHIPYNKVGSWSVRIFYSVKKETKVEIFFVTTRLHKCPYREESNITLEM